MKSKFCSRTLLAFIILLDRERSFNYFRAGHRERLDFSKLSCDELTKSGYVLAGSPDTVAGQFLDQMR